MSFWTRHRPMFYPFFFYFRFLYLLFLLIFVFMMFLMSVGVPLSTVTLDVFYVTCHVFRFAETIAMSRYINNDNKPPPKNLVQDGKLPEETAKDEEDKSVNPDVPLLPVTDGNVDKLDILITGEEKNSLLTGQNPPELERDLSHNSAQKDANERQLSKSESIEIKFSPKRSGSSHRKLAKGSDNET